MHGLIVSKEQTAREILLLLEAALCYSQSPGNSIVKQLLHWDLAVKFAKFHQMKLPEEFLKHCAKEDLWLPFVLFIQLHQYPVDQVSLYASLNIEIQHSCLVNVSTVFIICLYQQMLMCVCCYK